MERHFQTDIDKLKTTIIKMASMVEVAVDESTCSLLESDRQLAIKVIEGDQRVNALEIEIDNAIIDLLALQQPVATDLRFILAATRITHDLERIGDHAVNIAESDLNLAATPDKELLLEIPRMAEIAQTMLKNAIDGFIHNDSALGQSVLQKDDVIDELNRTMAQRVLERMKLDQNLIEEGMDIIRVSKNLERIADLATNIAEDVIFITQARVVKHHAEDNNFISGEKP
ncbi:MAG: phosphate signaling complex protein PhoU [Bacteroidota bacterium]